MRTRVTRVRAAAVAVMVMAMSVTFVPIASATGVPFTECASGTPATVTSIDATTWPPLKGEVTKLTITGTSVAGFTPADVAYSVKFMGIEIDSGSIKVPILAGDFTIIRPVRVPASAGSGAYVLTLEAMSKSGAQVLCIEVAANIG